MKRFSKVLFADFACPAFIRERIVKITIITVCYNSEKTINDCISSVLSQRNIELEYILVDGKSKDGTVDIIKGYAEKNKVIRWVSEPDSGIYDAMNKGIAMSTGDIIGILNSDDYYANENVLSSVVDEFSHNITDSCYGDLMYVRNSSPYRYWKAGNFRTFRFGWMPPHPAFFVRRSVYEKYGNFRLDIGTSADYELMLRLLEKNRVSTRYIKRLVTVMRVGGASNKGLESRCLAYGDDAKAWTVNGANKLFFTLPLKKLRKLPQFMMAKWYKKSENCVIH